MDHGIDSREPGPIDAAQGKDGWAARHVRRGGDDSLEIHFLS